MFCSSIRLLPRGIFTLPVSSPSRNFGILARYCCLYILEIDTYTWIGFFLLLSKALEYSVWLLASWIALHITSSVQLKNLLITWLPNLTVKFESSPFTPYRFLWYFNTILFGTKCWNSSPYSSIWLNHLLCLVNPCFWKYQSLPLTILRTIYYVINFILFGSLFVIRTSRYSTYTSMDFYLLP